MASMPSLTGKTPGTSPPMFVKQRSPGRTSARLAIVGRGALLLCSFSPMAASVPAAGDRRASALDLGGPERAPQAPPVDALGERGRDHVAAAAGNGLHVPGRRRAVTAGPGGDLRAVPLGTREPDDPAGRAVGLAGRCAHGLDLPLPCPCLACSLSLAGNLAGYNLRAGQAMRRP